MCKSPCSNIYSLAKYALEPQCSSSSSHIPDLVQPNGEVASLLSEKAAVFHRKFFPPAPTIPPPLSDAPPTPFPPPVCTLTHITRAIAHISPWKVPAPSGIPNVAISAASHVITPILLVILEAGMRLDHFPDSWKLFITATLRKPGKSDYTVPGAFRPITEEECLSKIIESVLADWLSELVENKELLSRNQFGG
ncbi:hypothetical protein B0H17DRAFT_917130, partial [Mycena rosella]